MPHVAPQHLSKFERMECGAPQTRQGLLCGPRAWKTSLQASRLMTRSSILGFEFCAPAATEGFEQSVAWWPCGPVAWWPFTGPSVSQYCHSGPLAGGLAPGSAWGSGGVELLQHGGTGARPGAGTRGAAWITGDRVSGARRSCHTGGTLVRRSRGAPARLGA